MVVGGCRSFLLLVTTKKCHRTPNLRSVALNLTELRSVELGTDRSRTDVSPAPQQALIYANGRALFIAQLS